MAGYQALQRHLLRQRSPGLHSGLLGAVADVLLQKQ